MAMRTVLLVDDDHFMRDLGRIQLEAVGFAVESCADPFEALSATRARRFDLIIVDIAMPQMSGLEFLARLRRQEAGAQTPVLVLSAWSSEETRADALRLGADWLDKPAPAARLAQRVNWLIDQSEVTKDRPWVQNSAS